MAVEETRYQKDREVEMRHSLSDSCSSSFLTPNSSWFFTSFRFIYVVLSWTELPEATRKAEDVCDVVWKNSD